METKITDIPIPVKIDEMSPGDRLWENVDEPFDLTLENLNVSLDTEGIITEVGEKLFFYPLRFNVSTSYLRECLNDNRKLLVLSQGVQVDEPYRYFYRTKEEVLEDAILTIQGVVKDYQEKIVILRNLQGELLEH